MKKISNRLLTVLCTFALMSTGAHATAAKPAAKSSQSASMPRLVQRDGHYALLVDGQPFIMLGAQAHNSSNYPYALGKVWAAVEDAHANTLEIPVAWEQVEPVENKFDFSYVDTLIKQAREHKVRLVLLWFGTWKNTSPQYTPEWVKVDNKRFPRMVDKDGKVTYCLSPYGEETLKADRKAFVALMSHLKKIDDKQHTVIMMQVENEAGTYGYARDFGPKAQAAFNGRVPQVVLDHKKAPVPKAATGTWSEVYGDYADEYFHAWAVASYIEEIAKAGRAVYDLPMYVNNALRDPLEPMAPWKGNFASGGPTYDVIDIYKAAAPHIDIAAPDIYESQPHKVTAVLDGFQRPDNALFVPEMGNAAHFVRYVYQVLGRGAIGVAPFGVDYADYSNYPLGSKLKDKTMVEPFGKIYAAFRPMEKLWATWALEGRTNGIAENDQHSKQSMAFKGWNITVSFREWQFGERPDPASDKDLPPGTESPTGGVAAAQLGDDEFVVTGQHARIGLEGTGANAGKPAMFVRVEEGRFDGAGQWVMERNWNGDQADHGLNFTGQPVVLKLKIRTY